MANGFHRRRYFGVRFNLFSVGQKIFIGETGIDDYKVGFDKSPLVLGSINSAYLSQFQEFNKR